MWFKPRLDHRSGSHNNLGESAAFVITSAKWLDFQVFSDKDSFTVGPASQDFSIHKTVGR